MLFYRIFLPYTWSEYSQTQKPEPSAVNFNRNINVCPINVMAVCPKSNIYSEREGITSGSAVNTLFEMYY